MFEIKTTRPQGLFDQLDAMQRLLAQSFGGEGAPGGIRSVAYGAFPEINVGRTATSVEVFAFAPGIDASSIEVTIERGLLKISGVRTSNLPSRESKVQLYANERPEGRFTRGMEVLRSGASQAGAARFAAGEGRGGTSLPA